jgi:hypothetical protein
VVGGRLNGHRVAMKFAPQKSECAEVSWSWVVSKRCMPIKKLATTWS